MKDKRGARPFRYGAFLFVVLYTPMLYTGKGDDGTTKTFGCCDQRISKSSAITEALGALDEINSFLGVIKTNPGAQEMVVFVANEKKNISEIVGEVQNKLFIAQAEIAGADKHLSKEDVQSMENIINAIEHELPPISTFFVSGGTQLSALLDFARTLARRAERRVVAVAEEGSVSVGRETLAYLNRLSSLLYALSRQVNHKSGITEEPPVY
ncbi:MAG: ATP:cob(I)alamin adenosyltransferase [Candidatus Yonathbacteria bacterium RIFCSPHIGHO2_01_FULL_44_19]|nr:MAG: ATP:cob(I)alamin adenosyltransferase [Candidatus Yonathbacteria bacterium RIFCSPHIGHO2_01_FULL_44_19]